MPLKDESLIKFDCDNYFIISDFEKDNSFISSLSINYSKKNGKIIKSQSNDRLYPKDVIGTIPMIILSPDFKSITFGSPKNRREFIDRVLSQAKKAYLTDLLKLKRILKQRNNILNSLRKKRIKRFNAS